MIDHQRGLFIQLECQSSCEHHQQQRAQLMPHCTKFDSNESNTSNQAAVVEECGWKLKKIQTDSADASKMWLFQSLILNWCLQNTNHTAQTKPLKTTGSAQTHIRQVWRDLNHMSLPLRWFHKGGTGTVIQKKKLFPAILFEAFTLTLKPASVGEDATISS